ncbi:hypothetical protein LJD47_33985, partial [Escherichia coli]|nr:hypothetical protein [Escherichia coli]
SENISCRHADIYGYLIDQQMICWITDFTDVEIDPGQLSRFWQREILRLRICAATAATISA